MERRYLPPFPTVAPTGCHGTAYETYTLPQGIPAILAPGSSVLAGVRIVNDQETAAQAAALNAVGCERIYRVGPLGGYNGLWR